MRPIDATLANAGSEVRLYRETTRTRADEANVLALLAAYRGIATGNNGWEAVHALIWCQDGLFGGSADMDGFHLATLRDVPFSLRDALEIRLFAPGFELCGVPAGSDKPQPDSAPLLHWTLHREADDAGWTPTPPVLFPADNVASEEAGGNETGQTGQAERTIQAEQTEQGKFCSGIKPTTCRCITEFHHVFGTTCASVEPLPVRVDACTPSSHETRSLCPSTWDGKALGGQSVPRLWRLSEANRGIHWHLAAASVTMKSFETTRVRHAWGHGANLFLAVRHYLQADAEDGSLSTLSVCLGGFWRLSPDERHLEEVQPE